ncbi:MAG: PadR family transcriptional regulator [Candidatus Dormibacteria bacterium]|jgi:DNA-binding PadR family transcriptional regulator
MASLTWKRPTRDLAALAVLGLLAEQPRHPYEIQREVHQRRKEFAAGTPRAVYHAVDRLAAAGLIEPAETVREGRRPERTVYRISEAGRDEFSHWLVDLLAVPERQAPPFSAALSMLGYLPQREAIRALGQRLAQLQGMIASLDAVIATLRERLSLPRLFLIEREYERAVWQVELDWVGSLISDLESGALAVDQEWLQSHLGQPRLDVADGLATNPPASASAAPGRLEPGGLDSTVQVGGSR